jgi:hypothetical protein
MKERTVFRLRDVAVPNIIARPIMKKKSFEASYQHEQSKSLKYMQ